MVYYSVYNTQTQRTIATLHNNFFMKNCSTRQINLNNKSCKKKVINKKKRCKNLFSSISHFTDSVPDRFL